MSDQTRTATIAPPVSDPHRQVAAAHELGHAVVWHALGLDVEEIWIKGHGPAAHGHVWLTQTDAQIRTLDQERAVQTGLLAGAVAHLRWCQETGAAIEFSCAADERDYRARRTSPLGRRVSRTTVRADARRLVRVHWPAIARLTPVLADTGRLAPSRLPHTGSSPR